MSLHILRKKAWKSLVRQRLQIKILIGFIFKDLTIILTEELNLCQNSD